MCSSIIQIIFVIILVGGTAMTLVSLATPAWKEFHNGTSIEQSTENMANSIKNVKDVKAVFGLFTGACGGDQNWGACEDYFKKAPTWQKAAMACLILALACCVGAFIWSCVACFMCCCRSCLTPPLPILTGLACLLDIIGVAIYGAKSGDALGGLPMDQASLNSKSTFGYSFWIGIGAIITLFVDTIVGVCLVTTSKVSPI